MVGQPGWTLGGSLVGRLLTPTPAGAQPAPLLQRILTDPRLWADDAFAVFGSLDRWRTAGERAIEIYPVRVVSATKTDTPDLARPRLGQMTAAMQRPRPALRPAFAAAYAAAVAARAPGFRAEIQRAVEDESFRVVWLRADGQFLRRGVTIRSVMDTYGKPEKTMTEVVHGRGERRPAVLTLYHYANGTVIFVESDLAPTPGLVDRVVLDVPAASAVIFATTP
jgi:hypothetical protein